MNLTNNFGTPSIEDRDIDGLSGASITVDTDNLPKCMDPLPEEGFKTLWFKTLLNGVAPNIIDRVRERIITFPNAEHDPLDLRSP